MYRFILQTAVISGTLDDNSVVVDICSGVPQSKDVKPFDFTAEYQNRLMLCSYSQGNQGNRIDYSVTNAPDVYNGSDSSKDGKQSLFFGSDEKITAAASLYNRFGSNILSMFLVLKDSETYLLTGSSPTSFAIYPVSKVIGCPAPLTLAVSDITMGGEDGPQKTTRNMAFWLSGKGPVMFDGGSITKLVGIDNYFDPSNTEYIEWDVIQRARGWVDSTYNEYNLLFPSTANVTDNNVWLAFDLLRRKWYEKKPSVYPQAAWEVITENGEHSVYGGIDTGYMMYLENGTSWDGSGITQRVRTGDFFPNNDNMWDETLIRKVKLLTEKLESTTTTDTLDIYTWPDTTSADYSDVAFAPPGIDDTDGDVEWMDTEDTEWMPKAIATTPITQDIGSRRLLNIVLDSNIKGWAHAFEFVITTSTQVNGFSPVQWGIQYRPEKKNDKASDG
jgi:hypothetical protein